MFHLLLLTGGFIPLIYGANLLVDNASGLARHYNIPNLVIGLTIVAFGTSAPEMVVNIIAALEKESEIILGNIVGSNIFNTGVILGISAITFPLAVKKSTTWIEVPLAFIAAIIVLILGGDRWIDHAENAVVSRSDGFLLLLFFLIFMAYNFMLIRNGEITEELKVREKSPLKAVLLLITGLILLVLGGRMIVYGAIHVASTLGIPERIIALTIVSAGTSLPELATSVIAARKKNTDIAVGNIVGSNIFNIFLILGLSSIIYPVAINPSSQMDILMNILLSTLIFLFIFTGKGRKIERWEGMLLLFLYAGYLLVLLL